MACGRVASAGLQPTSMSLGDISAATSATSVAPVTSEAPEVSASAALRTSRGVAASQGFLDVEAWLPTVICSQARLLYEISDEQERGLIVQSR